MRFETHCHSQYSRDSLSKIEGLIRVAKQRNIDRLAITDHNTIEGALRARDIDPDLIVVGEEILTTKGELLAFYVNAQVPSGLEPMQAIERLKKQDAFISVSHPFDRLRHGWNLADLQEIIPYIDAIEVFNARSFPKKINQQALTFAADHQLAGTAGSDAHTLAEVGMAIMLLPAFDSAKELRNAITSVRLETRYSTPLVRLGSTYATWIRKLTNKK